MMPPQAGTVLGVRNAVWPRADKNSPMVGLNISSMFSTYYYYITDSW